MKNKKKTFMGLALLLAVLVLGIGYALTAENLVVNLDATAETTNGFKVKFSKAEEVTTNVDGIEEIKVVDDTKASMTVSLQDFGDMVTGKFTVENASSDGIKASFANASIVVNPTTSDYFEVTATPAYTASTVLENDGTTTFNVTVKLKKVNVTDAAITENFTITLSGVEAVAA